MKKTVFAVGMVLAVNAFAQEELPILDLIKNFKGGQYNLWDSGCRGVTLKVPNDYIVTAYGSGIDGQCLTREPSERIFVLGGYQVPVLTQLSEDEGVCYVKVKQVRGTKTAKIELSCNPT